MCGEEMESIAYVLKECEETRDEISEGELLKEDDKDWEVMKRIEEVKRKKINEWEKRKETEEEGRED